MHIDSETIRVLLVEDNPTDALIVHDDLAHVIGATFAVVQVEEFKSALDKIKLERFDVVLLDLNLPDSQGFETFAKLHNAAPDIPIVVLSGRSDGQIAVQAVHAGAQDYLVKGRLGENVLPRAITYAIERQRAERTLAESEGRYRFLIERSPDAYLVICGEKIVFANATSLKLFGAEHLEQIVGHRSETLISSDFLDIIHRGGQGRNINGSNFPIEAQCLRLDGTTLAVEGSSAAFEHEGRAAVQIVLRDISQRKKSEARFLRLVDSNAQGVIFWNTSGDITGANDAFLDLFGYDREDLEAGRLNWMRMTPLPYANLDRHAIAEIAAKGVCTPYEKEYIHKNGALVSVLVGAASFEDNPEEGVCFVVDLTERKALEQQFLRSQRMESIGTLAGGIAHDLNNTLAPIIMAVDLLKLKFPDNDSQEIIAIISASAHRGADMVRQVLSFARGIAGRRMEVQIRHLIRDVEKISIDTFPKNIQVLAIVPNNLWTALGDPTQLHQVLLNLCVNARDAMPNGGRLTISGENLSLDAQYAGLNMDANPGPYLFIQVEDSGTGMQPEIIEKIFDPFFTTKEVGKGTGLGLSTSLAIVKSHGGFLRVYSELGVGTKFKVYLPAMREPSPAVVAELAAEMPRGNGELILIVDDEASVRHVTQQTLQAFGYRVVLATDGADAVAIFARQGKDIAAVLTDMTMPVMDGAATIQVLRRMNPGVRIIAASGLSANGHASRAANLGVTHFLPKPYTAETLLKALKELLSST